MVEVFIGLSEPGLRLNCLYNGTMAPRMIPAMSKTKKATDQPTPKTPTKNRGTVFNLRLGLEREELLTIYLSRQDVEPDKTAVLLKAFDEFMTKRGITSPKKPASS
jgi:hypothetical protein